MQTVLACGLLAALVLVQFSPILGCRGDCVADLSAIHGAKLGAFEMVDVRLNVWILAWVQRALALDPLHLFDANAFYPASGALAGSEHMLGLALLTWPCRLFTSNAVAVYGLTLALTSLLLACNTYLLTRWLTDSPALSLAAAAVTSFMPWRAAELAHIQLLGVQWFPLVWLLASRILLGEARARAGIALAVALTLQLLTSYYLAYMITLSLLVLSGVLFAARVARIATVARFSMACAVPYFLLLAFSAPYLARSGRGEIDMTYGMGMVVQADDLERLWHMMTPYFGSFWSAGATPQTTYYVPLVVLVLALASWLPFGGRYVGRMPNRYDVANRRRQRAVLLALWITVFFAFSFMLGAELRVGDVTVRPPGHWASLWVPGFSHFRAPHRWSILVGLIAPILAAIGFQRSAMRLAVSPYRHARVLRVALVGAAVLTFAINVPWRRLRATTVWNDGLHAPAAYEVLAELPDGPVLEIPWYDQALARTLTDSNYLVASTIHWHPILNGVTGYPPPPMLLLNTVAQNLPASDVLELVGRMTGLRWIVVHVAKWPALRSRWRDVGPALRLAYADDEAWIYEVAAAERSADWIAALQSTTERSDTISGVSRDRVVLAPGEGLLEADLAGVATVQLPLSVRVTIRNDGDRVWPGLDYQRDGIVQLRYIFDRPDGGRSAAGLQALFADVAPGRPLTTTARVRTPLATGRYDLCLDLVQAFGDEIVPLAVPAVALQVEVTNLPGSDPSRPTLAGEIAAAAGPPDWPSRCRPATGEQRPAS